MADAPVDPRWPKILSLTVHEFRTPMTVVAGYIRMLLKDRAGPLNDQQRRLLEEAEKSCARLTALVAEVSDTARALMEAFWPGPLTLLLPRGPEVPDIVTAGRPLVGVRGPAHPVAEEAPADRSQP